MLTPLLLLAAAVSSPASPSYATPMPAVVLQLQQQSRKQLEALTRRVESAGGWWLELEDQVLLAAPAEQLELLITKQRVAQRLPALTPQSLMLQTRACGVDGSAQLPTIALAGRFALVWAPRRFVSYAAPDSSEWRPITPNQTLARDQSLRGPDGIAKGTINPAIQARVDAVDPQRWFTAVQDLSAFDRSSYGTGIDGARDWLAAAFSDAGLSVQLQTFTFSGVSVENVIARLPGNGLSDELIVIGGHYDSRNTNNSASGSANTPGAEDNASGCAGVLELARVFAQFPRQRSLVFVCFAGEEQGLRGGTAFVEQLFLAGELAKVKLAVIMDMIGYSGDTDLDVLLETSQALNGVYTRYIALQPVYAPELRIVTSSTPCCSDHMPFINTSTPALLTIENDWNSYLHYHTTNDIPANMTRALEMGGAILKLNTAVIADAAGLPIPPLFADGFE
jgi:hypothetical protein